MSALTEQSKDKQVSHGKAQPLVATGERGEFGRLMIAESAIEFQSDANEIALKPVPFAAKAVLYLIALLFVLAIAWASIGEVDRVIVASGKITTEAPQLVVQPFETGIIRTINAHVGDIVHEGDLLVTLDPTFVEADSATTKNRREALLAQQMRLQAEMAAKEVSHFSDNAELEALNRRIDRARRIYVQSELATFDSQNHELTQQSQGRSHEIQDVKRQLETAAHIEQVRQQLYERKVGSLLQLLEATNSKDAMQRDLHKLEDSQSDFRSQIATLQQKRSSFIADWRNKTAEELKTVQQELDKIEQELSKNARRTALIELKAPADAVVLSLAQRSVGSVVREAETLLTLVPLNSPLQVTAELEPQDVARVRKGDTVTVKLDALPFQQHGIIHGTLKVVSDDTVERDPTSANAHAAGEDGKQLSPASYRAVVELEQPLALHQVPDDFHLIPGMGAKAEIKIGKRRLISYFLDPLTKAVGESLREP